MGRFQMRNGDQHPVKPFRGLFYSLLFNLFSLCGRLNPMQFIRRLGLNQCFKLFLVLVFLPLLAWAGPDTLENLQYRVTLSETTPGVDDSLVPGVDSVINVDVQDKLRGSGTRFPLKVYAIQEYFFSDNLLNLITRNTPKSSFTKPLYGFMQLNLDSPADSRQYGGIRKYYFSSDNRALVALFEQGTEGGPVTQSLGLVRWGDKPASLGWDLFTRCAGEYPQGIPCSRW